MRAYYVPSTVLIFGVRRCSDRPLHLSSGYVLIFLGGVGVGGMVREVDH